MRRAAWRAVAAVLLLAGAAGADEPRAAKVELALPALDSALNPDTGGLAFVVPGENRVVLYPRFAATRGTDEPVSARVGKLPVAIAYKKFGDKGYFLVACRDAAEVAVLDAATLKAVKAVPVKGGGPIAVVASASPKNRSALYTAFARPPGGRVSVTIGRIDLDALTDLGQVPGFPDDQTEYAPSADGAYLHGRSRAPGNAQGQFRTWQMPDPGNSGSQAVVAHPEGKAEGPGLIADPRGEFVVGGVLVCDPRTGKEVARLPFAPLAASATRPLLFGLKDDRLAAVSTNSFKVVGSAPLPVKKDELRDDQPLDVRGQPGSLPLVYRPRVFEDRAAKALLVCIGKTVLIVPEALLDLPAEPVLAIRPEGRPEFVVGRKGGFPLRPEGGTRAELVSGPEGLKLADGVLSWSPGPDAVGSHEATVRLSSGGAAKVVKLTLLVRRGVVELPFDPVAIGPNGRFLALSPDGNAAVVCGLTRGPADPAKVVYRVAVIDLAAGKVTADGALSARPTAAALDGSHVYIGLEGSNELVALRPKDLAEVRRVDVGGPVELITPVNGKFVAVTGRDRTTILSVPELRPATLPVPVPATTNPSGPTPRKPGPLDHLIEPKKPVGEEKERIATAAWDGIPPVWTGDGWWYRGVLYDARFEKTREVLDPRDFWQPRRPGGVRPGPWAAGMDDDPPGYRDVPNAVGERWYSPWGVTLEKRTLVAGGAAVARLPPGAAPGDRHSLAACVLSDHPAVAALFVSSRNSQDGAVSMVEVAFVDCAAQPFARVTLAEGRSGDVLGNGPVALAARGDRVVCLVRRQLYLVPIPQAEAAKCLPPLRFAPDYPTQVVAAAGETRLAVPKVEGAAGAVELALSREPGGMRYDAKAGQLVLAPDPLVERLTREVGDRVGRSAGYRPGGRGEFLDGYLKRASGPFERLTGRKPAGVPVWVPFEVVATNKGRRAEARFGFFVDLPLADVLARADGVARGGGAPGAPEAAGTVAELLREQARLNLRVGELEKKADDLTRKIDALLKALEAESDPKK